MSENLRAPHQNLVLKWGRALGMEKPEIISVSQGLKLRYKLGKCKKPKIKQKKFHRPSPKDLIPVP